jgi:riboflavin biosynthesis pyrimidine reductase
LRRQRKAGLRLESNVSRLPWIHLNFAVCEDGRMSADGASLPISCHCDWQRVHGLRETYDAVAVGAGTWINDRPRLNVRPESLGREPRRQPARVIFAGTRACTLPPDVRRTFVVGDRTPDIREGREDAVFIPCPGHGLAAALESLGRHGVRSLLVEGGPTLLSSFVAQGFFDRITVFVRTDSDSTATRAVRVALPGLPTLEADRLGEGVLLAFGKKEILARRF